MMPFDTSAVGRLERELAVYAARTIEQEGHRRASVLAPLVDGSHGWSLLLSKRSDSLSQHSGQIAFPGGGIDGDELPEQTALRETEEEIGVPASQIRLIGRLDDIVTISGYVVTPFVGIIPPGCNYVLQESEVVEVFEVPIEALLEPGNPQVRYVQYMGKSYPSLFYLYDRFEVWGLTGRMVKGLVDIIRMVV